MLCCSLEIYQVFDNNTWMCEAFRIPIDVGLVNPDEPEADEMELEMKEQMENEKKRWDVDKENEINDTTV